MKKMVKDLNDEIEEAIKMKQSPYLNFLQRTSEFLDQCKSKWNAAKSTVRKANQDSWDKFIIVIEKDVHCRQICAYKVLGLLNTEEKDIASLSVTDDSD